MGQRRTKKSDGLPDLAKGNRWGAFGLTEPNAGSDAANLRTTATRDGDSYILNGEKTWISLADYAHQFLVITRLTNTDAKAPYAAFIVDRNTPGFSSKALKGKLGVRAGNTGQIFFENMRVDKSCMLGEEGDGFKVAMSALDHGRYTVAAGGRRNHYCLLRRLGEVRQRTIRRRRSDWQKAVSPANDRLDGPGAETLGDCFTTKWAG